MTFEGEVGRDLFRLLGEHWPHRIEIGLYGPVNDPVNITVECVECHEVLIDTGDSSLEEESDDAG